VLWNPAWRGRIAISAPPNIQGLALTAILAHAGTADWRRADDAFRELRELAPSVKTFDPQPDGYTLVLNGTVVFATGWNARAQLYRDRSGGRLGVMLPDEGTVYQINTINVLRRAPHRAAAVAFMAYALSAAAQKTVADRMYYAPTNVMAQIDPEAESRTAASPFNMAKVVPLDWKEMAQVRDTWDRRWHDSIETARRR
jgi:putative spermidine/putrescine transport system substrate-binding protein